ncbi:MAG: hypothetical protein OEU09_20230 [Rhodospirillales bacterium]|nr:hypothetical protein [Rhodospirillales bacterium]MDH3913612.1 hypothetical protein [Rhodospirillales bacterium]MDH3917561.1 hypothetical protein [Rhodospirillales bacterium]MDH3967859.1 hypothetical protein [Rhodospirillales bacterium]
MLRLSRLLVAMLLPVAGLALAACELTPPSGDFPELTYGHLTPLRFDVASVEVEQAYQPSSEAPNVELLFPVRPGQAAANWGRDRLQAVGTSRRMRYIVREASVIETALETTSGLTGVVTRDQSERYEARLTVEVEILDDGGRTEGNAMARVVRSITVPENATLHEREEVWYQLTQKLMNDMNTQLEDTLKRILFRYLR